MQPYITIAARAQAEYEEKKSRFIGQVAHVQTEDEALAFLEEVRNMHPMARHNVYAYSLRAQNRQRYSDDGEPARTSGLPTLEVITHANLNDVICVTTRYFGGTLLGTGGLVRAYTKAAQLAFSAAEQVIYAQCVDISARFEYALYDSLNHWLKEHDIAVVSTNFSSDVELSLRVQEEESKTIANALTELTHGRIRLNISEASYRPLPASAASKAKLKDA